MADLPLGEDPNRPVRLYADGVFDLFHIGHARLLEQCKKKFKYVHLVVGVSNETDVLRFKGRPIMSQFERAESVRHCKWVDEVISPCPWATSLEFVAEHNIDFVCHDDIPYMAGGTGDDVYGHLKTAGKFLATQRTEGISSTDLINRLIYDYDDYVRRNIGRGHTYKELNISELRAASIELEHKLRTLEAEIEAWKSTPNSSEDAATKQDLEAKVSSFREDLKSLSALWEKRSEALSSALESPANGVSAGGR